jgi:hypothetical protein
VPPAPKEEKDFAMNEYDKNQDKAAQTDQQSDKPAFGQLDQEKGEGGQQEQDEAKPEELAGQRQQQGNDQYKRDEDLDQRNR